jgi:hypothetical protein
MLILFFKYEFHSLNRITLYKYTDFFVCLIVLTKNLDRKRLIDQKRSKIIQAGNTLSYCQQYYLYKQEMGIILQLY